MKGGGLLDFRCTPTATEFCIAEKFRDVPKGDSCIAAEPLINFTKSLSMGLDSSDAPLRLQKLSRRVVGAPVVAGGRVDRAVCVGHRRCYVLISAVYAVSRAQVRLRIVRRGVHRIDCILAPAV